MLHKNILKKISSALVILGVSASVFTPQLAHAEKVKKTLFDRGGFSVGMNTSFDATSGVGAHEATIQGQSRTAKDTHNGMSTFLHSHSRVGLLVPVAGYMTATPFQANPPTGLTFGTDGQVRTDFTVTRSELPALQQTGTSIKPAFYMGVDARLRTSLVDALGAAQMKQLEAYLTLSAGPSLTIRLDPAKMRFILAAIVQGSARLAGTQVTDLSTGSLIPGVKTAFAGVEVGGKLIWIFDDRLILTSKLTTGVLGVPVPFMTATGGTHGEVEASLQIVGPLQADLKGKLSNYTGDSLGPTGVTVGEAFVLLTIAD